MDAKLDKPLEELIKQSKGAKKAAVQGDGGGGGGPGKSGRRGKAKAASSRAAPYQTGGRRVVSAGGTIRQPSPHLAIGGGAGGRPTELTTAKNRGGRGAGAAVGGVAPGGTKLFIANLDFGVTTQDIHDLFSEVGPLRAALVHYGEDGKSLGTAYVVFQRKEDAAAAVDKYHSVPLDGRPLNVQMVAKVAPAMGGMAPPGGGGGGRRGGGGGGGGGGSGVPPRTVVTLGGGAPRGGRGGGEDRGRGRGGGRKGGRGKGGGKSDEPVSMEALDADLDSYRQGMAAE